MTCIYHLKCFNEVWSEWLSGIIWNIHVLLSQKQINQALPLKTALLLFRTISVDTSTTKSMYCTWRNTNLLLLFLNLLFCHCLFLCNLKRMVKLYLHLHLMRRRDLTTRLHIYICYLPAGRSILGKTVPKVLSTARGIIIKGHQPVRVYQLGRKLFNMLDNGL